jgi:hypothetical protein
LRAGRERGDNGAFGKHSDPRQEEAMPTTIKRRARAALALTAAACALAALAGCAGAPPALAPGAAPAAAASGASAPEAAKLRTFHDFYRSLPSIGLTSNAADGAVSSPVAGNAVAPEGIFADPSALGNAACVRTSVEYVIDGAARSDSFIVVMGGLESVSAAPGPVKAGAALGLAPGREIYCAIAADHPSPYLVVMSPRPAYRSGGRWWFDPSFLFSSGSTSWLTFDPIGSFDDAVRAMAEHVESEEPGMQVFFEQRFRFATALSEFPSPLTDEEAGRIAAYERSLYGRTGIYKFGQRVSAGGREVLCCWQGGFDRYLADEYELGGRIWLYGNLVTYDAWTKTALFFIRDFSLESVEQMYARKAPPAGA